jgi:hypothetical protein
MPSLLHEGIIALVRERPELYFGLIEASLSEAARKAFLMLPQGQQLFGPTSRRAFAEGEASAVLRVLRKRGIPVTDDQEKRILACEDLDTLNHWLDKAVTASSTDEIFAE